MPSFVYSTGSIIGNVEVYNGDSAPVWPVTQSGTTPTGSSWVISSAVLKVYVRNAFGNPYYTFFVRKGGVSGTKLGELRPDAAGTYNYLTFSAAEIESKNNFVGMTYMCLQGNGHTAMRLQSGTEITLTVNWSYTTSKCGAPTNITVAANTGYSTTPFQWSGATSGTNNSITGYQIQYADFDHSPSNAEKTSATYTGLVNISSTSTSGSTNVATAATPGYYRAYRMRTTGSAGSSFYSAWVYSSVCRRYTQGKAPQSVVASTNTPPLESPVTISWTLAEAGEGDSIGGYAIYRCEIEDGTYEEIGTVSTAQTYGSYETTSPDVFGGQYFYKVVTLSATSTLYNSPLSTVYAEITSGYGLVSAPTSVTALPSTTYPSGIVSISWSGAADGYLNPLNGYQIGRSTEPDGQVYAVKNIMESPAHVPAPSTVGAVYYYRVMSIGTVAGYNSAYSTAYAAVEALAPEPATSGRGKTNAVIE